MKKQEVQLREDYPKQKTTTKPKKQILSKATGLLLLAETSLRLVAGYLILDSYTNRFAYAVAGYFIATGVLAIAQQFIKKA